MHNRKQRPANLCSVRTTFLRNFLVVEAVLRKNTTINETIAKFAEAIMNVRGIDEFSDLISVLIREEWERRQPSAAMAERVAQLEAELRAYRSQQTSSQQPAPSASSPAPAPSVSPAPLATPEHPRKTPGPRAKVRKRTSPSK
jgi:hypothetical protein